MGLWNAKTLGKVVQFGSGRLLFHLLGAAILAFKNHAVGKTLLLMCGVCLFLLGNICLHVCFYAYAHL